MNLDHYLGNANAQEQIRQDLKHELQHVTQDTTLRKLHPSQYVEPPEDQPIDDYYNSQTEFHPLVTTAAKEFREAISRVKRDRTVDSTQLGSLFTAFVNPTAQMPSGFLKYKKGWNSEFFDSLYRRDNDKWKKAVKELHRLLA